MLTELCVSTTDLIIHVSVCWGELFVCLFILHVFYCLYVSFRGDFCVENIDDCMGVFCGNGTCVDGVNTFTCDCTAGYTGIECDSGLLHISCVKIIL